MCVDNTCRLHELNTRTCDLHVKMQRTHLSLGLRKYTSLKEQKNVVSDQFVKYRYKGGYLVGFLCYIQHNLYMLYINVRYQFIYKLFLNKLHIHFMNNNVSENNYSTTRMSLYSKVTI